MNRPMNPGVPGGSATDLLASLRGAFEGRLITDDADQAPFLLD